MPGNWRVAVAFAFIGAMLIALALLVLDGGEGEAEAIPPATVTTSAPSTSTPPSTSTSTAPPTSTTLDPEARKAQVERILEDLEIAWYDAVYRQDESVLPDIVATRVFYDAAVNAMGAAVFSAEPSEDTVDVLVYDVLLDKDDCLVVHFRLDASGVLREAEPMDGVQVLWPYGEGYRLVRRWSSPDDLWGDDCTSLDRNEIS